MSKNKKVWKPEVYETTIGPGTYTIEPQPIESIIEFDAVVKQLSDDLDGLSAETYYVHNGTGVDIGGPFEDEEKADQFVSEYDGEAKVRAESMAMVDVLSALVSTPYPPLKVLVPELKEEDCRQASLPNLKFVFDLIMKVNGLAWFENFVKNSLAPVLPEIIAVVVSSIKGALKSSTETEPTGGETD